MRLIPFGVFLQFSRGNKANPCQCALFHMACFYNLRAKIGQVCANMPSLLWRICTIFTWKIRQVCANVPYSLWRIFFYNFHVEIRQVCANEPSSLWRIFSGFTRK